MLRLISKPLYPRWPLSQAPLRQRWHITQRQCSNISKRVPPMVIRTSLSSILDLRLVIFCRSTPSIIFASTKPWNATHGDLNLTVLHSWPETSHFCRSTPSIIFFSHLWSYGMRQVWSEEGGSAYVPDKLETELPCKSIIYYLEFIWED